MSNESSDSATLCASDLEQVTCHEPLATEEMPRFTAPVVIRVISYRKRLTDTDGISVKAVLDGIVRAGILSDDTSEQVKEITFENRKSKDEKTIIEIDEVIL